MKEKISSYGIITLGTFLMAIGTNMIYQPMSMVTGGFSGIGIILNHLFRVPLWVVTTTLNIPLFILAGKKYGRFFIQRSLYATICFSIALAVIPSYPVQKEDFLMAAIFGGVFHGGGLGCVIRQGCTTGGSDLLSTLIQPIIPNLTPANIMGLLDGAIVVTGMLVFGIRTGLYAIVAVFITSKVVDRLVEGMKFAKLLYIISDSPEKITNTIMEEMQRGVTALQGQGAYSGKDRKILLCAVSKKEIVTIIRMVKRLDEKAFVIISDVREIRGEGFN